jgi:hypothetical protein
LPSKKTDEFKRVLEDRIAEAQRMIATSDSTASFAFDAGGGAELHLGHRCGLRPVQLDWLATNHAHNPHNTFRYSSTIMWTFR